MRVIKQHSLTAGIDFSIEIITIAGGHAHVASKFFRRIRRNIVNHTACCLWAKLDL